MKLYDSVWYYIDQLVIPRSGHILPSAQGITTVVPKRVLSFWKASDLSFNWQMYLESMQKDATVMIFAPSTVFDISLDGVPGQTALGPDLMETSGVQLDGQ